jgi:hypothetical protein
VFKARVLFKPVRPRHRLRRCLPRGLHPSQEEHDVRRRPSDSKSALGESSSSNRRTIRCSPAHGSHRKSTSRNQGTSQQLLCHSEPCFPQDRIHIRFGKLCSFAATVPELKTQGGRRQSCKERKEEHPAWKFRRETSKAKSPILPCSKTERKSAHPTTTLSANSGQIEYAHLSLYTGQGAGHDVGVVRALPGRQLGIADRLQSGVVPIWVSTKMLRHRKPAY